MALCAAFPPILFNLYLQDSHLVCASQGVLFEHETYRSISKNHNLIAFVIEIPLLLRVLKAAGNNAADSLEVKLAMRTMPSGATTQPVSRPYLTFASKGNNLNMTQDLPVSKPYTASRKPSADMYIFVVDVLTAIYKSIQHCFSSQKPRLCVSASPIARTSSIRHQVA